MWLSPFRHLCPPLLPSCSEWSIDHFIRPSKLTVDITFAHRDSWRGLQKSCTRFRGRYLGLADLLVWCLYFFWRTDWPIKVLCHEIFRLLFFIIKKDPQNPPINAVKWFRMWLWVRQDFNKCNSLVCTVQCNAITLKYKIASLPCFNVYGGELSQIPVPVYVLTVLSYLSCSPLGEYHPPASIKITSPSSFPVPSSNAVCYIV